MVTADYMRRIAAWSRELNERESELAHAGVVDKTFKTNEFICMLGNHFDYWIGVVTGPGQDRFGIA
jgi:CRP/FNR family transcriptional regulator, cyclic AMP receptor protein